MLEIETLTKTDSRDIVSLSERLGWDYSEEEIDLIIKSGYFFGHRSYQGKVISTAAVFPYKTIASLGVVMVDPDYRRMGLGTQLVQKCISKVPNIPIMLVATEEGKPLYEKLGFLTVDILNKLVATEYKSNLLFEMDRLQSITNDDIEEILRLDKEAFGADRSTFLKLRIQQATYRVMLQNQDGKILGFALGVQTPDILVIGPVVAPDQVFAYHLIDYIARKHKGPMRIDIPSEHQRLSNDLLRYGFKIERNPPIMLINGTELPSRKHVFALAAQAYG
jgi:GNAT superfamily N-acetyltransferase